MLELTLTRVQNPGIGCIELELQWLLSYCVSDATEKDFFAVGQMPSNHVLSLCYWPYIHELVDIAGQMYRGTQTCRVIFITERIRGREDMI